MHSDARRRGVGRRLIEAAEQQAQRRGCCKVTLEVQSENTAALGAYERCGFAPYVLDPAAGHALFLEKKLLR